MTQHFLAYLTVFLALVSGIASIFAFSYYKRFKKARHDYRYISRQLQIATEAYYAIGKQSSKSTHNTAA